MRVYIARKVHFNAAHKMSNPNWDKEKNEAVFGKCANENWRPLIPEWGEINAQIMGEQLGLYLNDQISAEEALATAKEQIEAVMEREGYYGWNVR